MDQTAAEAFPALYRSILDGVAELEQAGHRADALAIRRAATAAYSGAWGAGGRRRLESLVARIERTLAGSAGPSRAPMVTLPWLPIRPAERAAAAPKLRKLTEPR